MIESSSENKEKGLDMKNTRSQSEKFNGHLNVVGVRNKSESQVQVWMYEKGKLTEQIFS